MKILSCCVLVRMGNYMLNKKILFILLFWTSLVFSTSSDTILGQYLSASFDFKFQKNDKQSSWKKKEEALLKLSDLKTEERLNFYIKAYNYANIDGESFEDFFQTIICNGDTELLKRKLDSLVQRNNGFTGFSQKNNLLLDILKTLDNRCLRK